MGSPESEVPPVPPGKPESAEQIAARIRQKFNTGKIRRPNLNLAKEGRTPHEGEAMRSFKFGESMEKTRKAQEEDRKRLKKWEEEGWDGRFDPPEF